MAGLCAVLLLYLVLICLASATWAQLSDGFDTEEITRIACEVRFVLLYAAEACLSRTTLVSSYGRGATVRGPCRLLTVDHDVACSGCRRRRPRRSGLDL